MSLESSPSRRLLQRLTATIVIWWVFAMGAVANKTAWELGPEWCARYMLIKYMLFMEDSSCSNVATAVPVADIAPGSPIGEPLLETLRKRYEDLKLSDF